MDDTLTSTNGSRAAPKPDEGSGSDRRTFSLAHPFTHRGKRYAELSVRRPKVKDIINAERQPGEIAREAALLAIIAGIDFAAVGEMDVSDYSSIVARAGVDFLSQPGREDLPGS